MKKTLKRFLVFAIAIVAVLALVGCGSGQTDDGGSAADNAEGYPMTLTDLGDNQVTLSAQPQHIATLYGNSFQPVIFLGGADRMTMTGSEPTEWLFEMMPEYADYDITVVETPRESNIEELLASEIDTVFFWNDIPDQVQNMQAAGINVFQVNPSSIGFVTAEEWRDVIAREITLYANVLGGEANAKAEQWLEYLDETIAMVSERTANLTEDEIPDTYCIRTKENGLECFAKASYDSILMEIAGGNLVSRDVDAPRGFAEVTIEQVLEWDPDYIFTGWLGSSDFLDDNEQWAEVTAVKNGDVYDFPCSLDAKGWSYTTECPLQLLYYAKTLHPDLFEDVDLTAEVQEFYKTFYDYDLSAEGVEAMFNRQGPSAN